MTFVRLTDSRNEIVDKIWMNFAVIGFLITLEFKRSMYKL